MKKLSITTILLIFLALSISAQENSVSVIVNVLPPYSHKVNDYIDNNKILVTLQYMGMSDNPEIDVYLQGEVSNDGGDRIYTNHNHKPAQPITLTHGMPLTITPADLEDIFNFNYVETEGINKQNLYSGAGLPEGTYTICIRAYNYNNNQPVSVEEPGGCSAPFEILNLEAPEFIQPECGEIISNQKSDPIIKSSTFSKSTFSLNNTNISMQGKLFSWIIPSGAPIPLEYELKIKKVPEELEDDPAVIMNSDNVFIDYSEITNATSVYLDNSKYDFEPGFTYIFTVTASDPDGNLVFQNNGTSEVCWITYEDDDDSLTQESLIEESGLTFLIPNEKHNTIKVNNETPFLLNWNWIDLSKNTGSLDTLEINDELYKKLGVVKYRLNITALKSASPEQLSDQKFTFQKLIETNFKEDTILRSYLNLPLETVLAAGFKNEYWYSATVEALDKNNKVVQTAESVGFQYKQIADEEPTLVANIRANINYEFKGKPGQYKATNTPVTVQLMRRRNAPIGFKPFDNIIGESTVETDDVGNISADVAVLSETISTDSIYCRIVMSNNYYIDYQFPIMSVPVPENNNLNMPLMSKDTVAVHFGQLTAQTFAYSLKLFVNKIYYGAPIVTGVSMMTGIDLTEDNTTYAKVESGIPIVVYRKNKLKHVPPVEGDIQDYKHKTGSTEIARGLTQVEKNEEGQDVAFVKFDRLLASVFNGDQYYIQAFNPSYSNTDISSMQTVPQNQGSFVSPYSNVQYNQDGYVAPEIQFKIDIPNIDSSTLVDSLYRNIEANYDIVSTKPPTSKVKGKLVYKWESDDTGVIRPVANTNFRIVVDYLKNGEPYRLDEGTYFSTGELGNRSTESLNDYMTTMATGVTDSNGNFEIDVDNLNTKGSLGTGNLFTPDIIKNLINLEKEWIELNKNIIENAANDFLDSKGESLNNPMSNPWNWNGGIQGSYMSMAEISSQLQGQKIGQTLNSSTNVTYNAESGVFEVGETVAQQNAYNQQGSGGMQNHGPSPNPFYYSNQQPSEVAIERVYRIIIDNPHLAPSNNTFVVQPLENTVLAEPILSLVKERKVTVITLKDGTKALTGIKVIVFRSLKDETDNLPLGEGDGLYLQKELPGSLQENEIADIGNTDLQSGSNLFNTKMEYIWPQTTVDDDGKVEFKGLLAGCEYYLEAYTPTDKSGNTYKPTFATIEKSEEDKIIRMYMEPLPSRALIRVMDKSTGLGLKGAIVYVKNSKIFRPTDDGVINSWGSDKDGYVEMFADQHPLVHKIDGLNSTVHFNAYKEGYTFSEDNDVDYTFENTTGSQFAPMFNLEPGFEISGHIVSYDIADDDFTTSGNDDLTKKAYIDSYINLGDTIVGGGANVKTTGNYGFYSVRVPKIAGSKIRIIPEDLAYFDTVYTVTNADIQSDNISNLDIEVFRRKHRIKFHIFGGEDINSVAYQLPGARVQLGDLTKTTDSAGDVTFEFENVSVNNHTFIIRGPKGSNYIPKTVNVKSEETEKPEQEDITLLQGSEITGTVKLDGKPVFKSKVYIDASQQGANNDANLAEAYTDVSGNYSLHGVPANNTQINLLATLDTTFTVNGDRQTATIINKSATANFNLTRYNSMYINNLYGFPLTVEKIEEQPNSEEVKVSGIVHWSEAISDFESNETNQVIRVENVLYKPTEVDGRMVGIPVSSVTELRGTSYLNLKYLDKYNVQLKSKFIQQGTPSTLSISKDGGYGKIHGKVSIVDNSFNYPSTYLNFTNGDDFYLANKLETGKVSNQIWVVKSAMKAEEAYSTNITNMQVFSNTIQNLIEANNQQVQARYYLTNEKNEPINFELLKFKAKAEPTNSYIAEDGKIHLQVNLDCHIPNSEPEDFKLTIDDMVLDENKVYPASSNSPINLKLEKWVLQVKDWCFDVKEGGITSKTGIIKTGMFDIPFKEFVLRHDMFKMGEFQVNDLKLGGIVDLIVLEDADFKPVYDYKCGSDMKPHWRISASGTATKPVARTEEILPGINSELKLNYVQILSNNEKLFQLSQEEGILVDNPLAKFKQQALINGPTYFNIAGGLNLGAPRVGDIALSLRYTRDNGNLEMEYENINLDFEGKGFVHFNTPPPELNQPKNIRITAKNIEIDGEVGEKPTPTFNPMPATFYASANTNPIYHVDIDPGHVANLSKGNDSEGYNLKIETGGMKVEANDWSLLSYKGDMQKTNPQDGDDATKMTFTVTGDVSANAEEMTVTSDSKFGSVTTIYDFNKSRLTGTIVATDVQLGLNKISGTIETLFDPDGFYVAGGVEAHVNGVHPLVNGEYNLGFMIGNHVLDGVDAWEIANTYKDPLAINTCYKDNINSTLAGFYFTLDRVIFDVSYGFDYVLVSGHVRAKAIVGVDVFLNFPLKYGLNIHAVGDASAGLGSYTGTSIEGSSQLLGDIDLCGKSDALSVSTSIDMTFGAKVCQSLVVKTVCKSKTVSASAQIGNQGMNFELVEGDEELECPCNNSITE